MENWSRIHKWLEKNAPKIRDALQPPASNELLERVQSLSGELLPDQFRELYSTHNGLSNKARANLFYGMPFIPLERVIKHLEAINQRENDFDLQHADVGIKAEYRLGNKRIPIADDYGTSLLCIDLDPSDDGRVGQIIFIDYKMDTGLLMADSITDLLSKFSTDLEAGKYELLEEAKQDGDDWLEPERSIDVVNWYNSQTWSYVK